MNNAIIRLVAQTEQGRMTKDPTAEGIHSLAYFRKWKLLHQRELAEMAGVQPTTISFIEQGRTQNHKLMVMRKICEALGVPADRISEFRVALGIEVKVKPS